MSRHPTFIACVGLCVDLYNEWTREQPPSGFTETYSTGDQLETGVDNSNNPEVTYSHDMAQRSTRGGQIALESGSGGELGTVKDDVEIYPDDSLTLIFEAAGDQDDANEPPDDEHTDDESDKNFYARLNMWVTSVQPGPPPPPSPAPTPAHSHAGSRTIIERDTDSEDGSTTFVGVMDCKTSGMEVSVGLKEKLGTLSYFSFLNPGTV